MTPRERLATARLYLVCPARPREWIAAAVRGGVDLVQLRDKTLDDAGLVAAADAFRGHGALFVLNDRPDLVDACGADGVHVGQDDATPAAARAALGPDRIVGRSTHAPDQAAAAQADPDVDYLAVGPVHATPTKPGRPAAGLDYVAHAARTVTKPWFAIGGLDTTNV
ncbi:MAG TPA: thiamine phosphate synthase, partial [Solirubrobacter sp.]|nr:thiamine phosphate synthase [Solirubrobacter sp.]